MLKTASPKYEINEEEFRRNVDDNSAR
jgi:hypothetical protein